MRVRKGEGRGRKRRRGEGVACMKEWVCDIADSWGRKKDYRFPFLPLPLLLLLLLRPLLGRIGWFELSAVCTCDSKYTLVSVQNIHLAESSCFHCRHQTFSLFI